MLVRIDAVFEAALGIALLLCAATGALDGSDFPRPVGTVVLVDRRGGAARARGADLERPARPAGARVCNAASAVAGIVWLAAVSGFSQRRRRGGRRHGRGARRPGRRAGRYAPGVSRPGYAYHLREPVGVRGRLGAAAHESPTRSPRGGLPDTVLLLEHSPVITLGRRTEPGELHVPEGAEVEIVETDRGGKSTYHGPGQLVCYPIFDLTRHGQDVKRYCRDLEEALIRTLAPLGVEATRIEGLTGIWLEPPPRKIASIGIHISKWVTTHGYALNVDLDPAPFTDWITACGHRGRGLHDGRARARPAGDRRGGRAARGARARGRSSTSSSSR